MSVFTPTRNRKSKDEDVFQPTQQQGYDYQLIYGWESDSKAALSKLQTYGKRIDSGGFLTAGDLADYKSVLDSYINTSNRLRGIGNRRGSQAETEDAWTRSVAELRSGYESTYHYFSQWEDEATFQEDRKALQEREDMLNLDTEAAQKEIDEMTADLDSYELFAHPDAENGLYDYYYQKYGNAQDLRGLISNKKAYLASAKRLQHAQTLASVADPTSENYDPVFAKYRQYDSVARANSQGGQLQALVGSDILKDEEVDLYNYYLGEQGKAAAEAYKQSLQDTINYRKAEKRFENMKGNTFLELLFGVEAGLDQFASGVKNLFSTEDYIPASSTQMLSGMVREDLKDDGFQLPDWLGGASLGQTVYDTVTTTANMAPSIVTSLGLGMINPTLGVAAGSTLMFASSAGSAYQEALNLGYEKGQARVYSTLVGGSEAGLQYLLGGIGALGGKMSGNAVTKMLNGVDNAFIRVAGKIGGNMLSEGIEEGLQEILTPWFKNLTLRTNEGVNWSEVAYSSLLGAVTAGFLEGPGTVVEGVRTRNTGRKLQRADISAQRLAEIGKTFSADAVAYQLAGRVNESTGAYTLGRLFGQIGAELTAKNKADIAGYLEAKGVAGKDARILTDAFASVVVGGTFTARQQAALDANETLAQAVTDVIINPNSTVNQRSQGYNEVLMALAQEKAARKSTGKKATPVEPEEAGETAAATKGDFFTPTETVTETSAPAQEQTGSYLKADPDTEVKIRRFRSVKDGKAVLSLEDGRDVDIRDLELSPEQGIVYETVAGLGVNADAANLLVEAYTFGGKQNAGMYARGIGEAFLYGKYSYPMQEVAKGPFASTLSDYQRQTAYKLGKLFGGKETAKAQAKATGAKKGKLAAGEGISQRKGAVHFEGNRDSLTEAQHTNLAAVETVAEALGVAVYVYESYRKNGKRMYTDSNGNEANAPNGWYDTSDGSIHIDLYAGQDGQGIMLFALAHELTHFIRQWSPAKFKILANFLMKEYGKQGVSIAQLVGQQIAKAKNSGRSISYGTAYEEVIADSMEAMLSDGEVMQKLEKLKARDQSLWEKIKDFITGLASRIKAIYKDIDPQTREGRYVSQMKDAVERLQALFAEGLVDAGENYRARLTPEAEGKQEERVSEEKGVIKYSFQDSKSGMANDALSGYSKELSSLILERGDYIIDSVDKLVGIVDLAFSEKSKKATAYFGIINEDILLKIQNSIPNLPKTAEGMLFKPDRDYSVAVTLDAIRHLVDEKSLSREDVITYLDRLADTIVDFDSVWFDYYIRGQNKTPGLLFDKKFPDGSITSFDLVSQKKRSILLQSLYMENADYQKKKSAKTLPMQNTHGNTPKAQVGQTSTDSITQNTTDKQVFSDRGYTIEIESDILFSDREEDAFKRFSKAIDSIVDKAIAGKGYIDGELKPHEIIPAGPRVVAMVGASSNNAIDISSKKIAINSGEVWHEYNRHTNVKGETSRDQIAFTKRQYRNAIKCIVKPDFVESIFTNSNNPTQRQSFAYVKRTKNGRYVVVEAVGGKRSPYIYPVMILQFTRGKWNKMKASGLTLGEVLFENNPNLLNALDIAANKKSRVSAAQFASYEAIANTLRSSQLNDTVTQENPEVNMYSDRDYRVAGENYQSSEQTLTESGIAVNEQTESGSIYTYESLIAKNAMVVTKVGKDVPSNRVDVVAQAKKNAAKIGEFNPKNGSVSVRVDDNGAKVTLGTTALKHGLRRTKNPQGEASYIVTPHAGEILKHSIQINEALPKHPSATGSYVLFGMAENVSGERYLVRFVVNEFRNDLESMDLYAINAKKELAALNAPRATEKPLPATSSAISISELLDLVNEYFPQNLPEDVLKHFGYERRPDGDLADDMLYSDRDSEGITNRSLLANALAGAAQNESEKGRLQEYRDKIGLMNAEEEKLHGLNRQIKELSFAKGPRDKAKILALQTEARKTANRINIYDKQLLRLEASAPLQNVLARERKAAYKRAEQKGRQALADYRKEAQKKLEETEKRYQKAREKGIESRKKTAMRHKIQNVVKELNTLLLKGTKERHIPEELQKAVAEALNAVNMDTVGAQERIDRLEAELLAARTPEKILEISRKIDHVREMGGKMSDNLGALKAAYDKILTSDDPLIANGHDAVISSQLEAVIGSIGDTPLRDMTLAQLEDVYDMYRMVLTAVENANKAFVNARRESISAIAEAVMTELGAFRGKKDYDAALAQKAQSFSWNNLKPVYAFERIGSDTFTELYNAVRNGEDVWAVDVTQARNYYLSASKKYGFDGWDFDERYSFTSTSGLDFELSLEQIMSLYAFSRRDQAKEHLKKGGIVIDEDTAVTRKTKLGIKMKFNPTKATAYNLSEELLADITGKLTEEQRDFVEAMQAYLSEVMGAKGNEVSRKLYGIQLFKEKFYFPLKSAPQYMAKAKEQQHRETKIKNKGFTRETQEGASNPIVLTPFMEVWADHVNEMSMYHAFTLPLEDFNRVFSYKTPVSETAASKSVVARLQNAHGKAAVEYIDELLKDLNGGVRIDATTGVINKLTGLFKKGAVFGSLSVTIQQPTAIARAFAIVEPKYFVGKKVDKKRHGELWEEVKRYAPVAIIKEMGYFDTNMGMSAKEFITSKVYSGFWQKMKAVVKDSNYRDEILAKAPALADELAWCSIWEAVKRETLSKHHALSPRSEAFLQIAGKRFTEVITKTQVYDSVLSRSAFMRSKDTGMKMATAFLAEPTTSINMIYDALLKAKRGKGKYARKAIGAVIAAQILNSILVSFVYAGRDDDDEKTYLEKYLGTLTAEIFDSLDPLTYIPFVKDIVSIVQGYDVERSDMAVISDLWNAWQKLDSDQLSPYRKVENFAGSVAQIFGLPVKNIMRDVRGIYQTVASFLGGAQTTASGIGYAVKENIPEWLGGGETAKQEQLYDAIVGGDKVYLERLRRGYKTESSYKTAVRKALRENDPRVREAAAAKLAGNGKESTAIGKEIAAEGFFSGENVEAAIDAEVNKLLKELREDDPRIREAAQAVVDGRPSERANIAKQIQKEGKFALKYIQAAINAEVDRLREERK